MTISRVPKEPAEETTGEQEGFVFVPTLDFSLIEQDKGSPEYTEKVKSHMMKFEIQCQELSSDLHDWEKTSEQDGTICEHLKVAGTGIPMVKHTSTLDFPAQFVFQVINSLTYTSVVDPYAFHVECKDVLDIDDYDWTTVTWTVDNIFPVFAARDFCTLDFVRSEDMTIMSKSVEHPLVPRTELPSKTSSMRKKTTKSRTYRVPLFWFIKVVPIDENKCTMIQVQWSDVGGVIPEDKIYQSVEKFGFDSTKRMSSIISHVKERELVLPEVKSPIIPSWERKVHKIIHGLDTSY